MFLLVLMLTALVQPGTLADCEGAHLGCTMLGYEQDCAECMNQCAGVNDVLFQQCGGELMSDVESFADGDNDVAKEALLRSICSMVDESRECIDACSSGGDWSNQAALFCGMQTASYQKGCR